MHDLAIPVQRSNQLSYEATDIGSWSIVSSNEPVSNECEVIYEMFHILSSCLNCIHNCEDHSLQYRSNVSYQSRRVSGATRIA